MSSEELVEELVQAISVAAVKWAYSETQDPHTPSCGNKIVKNVQGMNFG